MYQQTSYIYVSKIKAKQSKTKVRAYFMGCAAHLLSGEARSLKEKMQINIISRRDRPFHYTVEISI